MVPLLLAFAILLIIVRDVPVPDTFVTTTPPHVTPCDFLHFRKSTPDFYPLVSKIFVPPPNQFVCARVRDRIFIPSQQEEEAAPRFVYFTTIVFYNQKSKHQQFHSNPSSSITDHIKSIHPPKHIGCYRCNERILENCNAAVLAVTFTSSH